MSSHCSFHIVADSECIDCSRLAELDVEVAGTSDVLTTYLEQDFETDLTARPPTRTALIAHSPWQQYCADFPNGHRLVVTPGNELLCGLYALQRSILYQTSLLVPSIEDLTPVVYAVLEQIVAKTENAMSHAEFERNFSYDNLTQILAEYGRYRFLNLQLGVHFPRGCYPNGVRHRIMNAFKVDEKVTMIWVYLDPTSIGHYSGMRHPPSPRCGGLFQGIGASHEFLKWYSADKENVKQEDPPKSSLKKEDYPEEVL